MGGYLGENMQPSITPLGQTVSISASSASPYIQIQIGPSPPPPPFSCTLTSEEVIALNDIETTFYGEGSGGDPKTLQEWCDTQIL